MTKSSKKYLIAAILVFIVSFFYCGEGKAGVNKITIADTVKPKPIEQKEYFIKLNFDPQMFGRKMDTIGQVASLIGRSLTVDESDRIKNYVTRFINSFYAVASLDSTTIRK